MKRISVLAVLFFVAACTPAQKYPRLVFVEEKMVQDCQYVETLSETADPGRLLPKYTQNDAEQRVLERADRLGATHVVWLYNYRIGSAALIYRCHGE